MEGIKDQRVFIFDEIFVNYYTQAMMISTHLQKYFEY